MRFANFTFIGKEKHNLGDNLQLMAIDNLYKFMNLYEEDIVKIPYNELATWVAADGEKDILPISFPFLEYNDNGLSGMFSDSIVPVFLGLTLLDNNISTGDIAFLKKHEPIGCRDEYTYNNLKRAGIHVWLNGCMTLTMFQKQSIESLRSRKRVLIIDVCNELLDKIPQSVTENAIYLSQIATLKDNESINDYVLNRYQMYYDKAKLVITSRLHCAIPLVAMGIPVVLAVKEVSFRFSWVEKLLHIYTPDEFDKIDWNPSPIIHAEKIKTMMMQNAVNRISGEFFDIEDTYKISDYWLSRTKKEYYIEGYDEAIECIRNFGKFDEVEYAFWGMTVLTKMIYSYIKNHYPNANLKHVFDKYRSIDFDGLTTESIGKYEPRELQNLFIFVTASAATKEADELFREINKNHNYCLCYEQFV